MLTRHTKLLSLLLGGALCLGASWANAGDKAASMLARKNDPRSGAALNLEAAKAARAAGLLPAAQAKRRDRFHPRLPA